MSRVTFILLFLFASLGIAVAQSGSAPSGYYPDYYRGATFRGTVESNDNGQLTLKYEGKKKTDSFRGHFESVCAAEGKQGIRTFAESDIPVGSELIAFYNPKKIKVGDRKQKDNQIIGIAFTKMEGQEIPSDKWIILWCTQARHMTFRYW